VYAHMNIMRICNGVASIILYSSGYKTDILVQDVWRWIAKLLDSCIATIYYSANSKIGNRDHLYTKARVKYVEHPHILSQSVNNY